MLTAETVQRIPSKSLKVETSSSVMYIIWRFPVDGSMATLLLIGNWMRAFFDVHVKVTPKLGPRRGGQSTLSGSPSLTLLVKSW